MAQHGIPPLWPYIVSTLRSNSSFNVMVPDMATLHTLSQTVGATAVRPLLPLHLCVS